MTQQPYATLPSQLSIDRTNQYSMVTPVTAQQSQYNPMMAQVPTKDMNLSSHVQSPLPTQPMQYSINVNRGNF